MDNRKWLLLNRYLDSMSEINSESKDLVLLVSQLVLELASELPYIRTGKEYFQETINSYNQNEELE